MLRKISAIITFIFFAFCIVLSQDNGKEKEDTNTVKLEKIQMQQQAINIMLDSIWLKLEIDSTLRKK